MTAAAEPLAEGGGVHAREFTIGEEGADGAWRRFASGSYRGVWQCGDVTRSDLRLRPVRLSDEEQVRSAQQDLLADDFDFAIGLRPETSWPEYVEQLDRFRRAAQLPEPWVPATFLLAFVGGDLVGRTSIRHHLNDFLLAVGGHIGYAVLPAFRRRGFATEILVQSLVIARSYGANPVLVTCDEDNDASARVITRCGGVLENIVENPEGGSRKRRYWVQ